MAEKVTIPGVVESPVSPVDEKALLPQWDAPSTSSTNKERFLTVLCILLNTFSTVALVFLNKIIFSDTQLKHCQVLIAIWHFTATGIVLFLATQKPLQTFKAVRLPFLQMVPISAFFAGFLLLSNLSLTFNSIGFYQLARILTAPTVVLLNLLLFRKTISRAMAGAIVCVCIGVALTNTQTARSNPMGAIIAVAAFTVTALYQIWIGKKMADLDVTAPQLLLNQAPVSVMLLCVIMPFCDTLPDFAQVPIRVMWTFFASGLVASLFNLSQFLIIGRTSALTFNVVSNLKTIIIISLSWYSEGHVLTLRDAFGVFMAIGGGYIYARLSAL
ncbi:MAG: hypothetical protein M4579_001093 [Chaenotheca gracillima]|nr:MAG: hypothetical protein M4579_001093 [Chaenotheca gracillima]